MMIRKLFLIFGIITVSFSSVAQDFTADDFGGEPVPVVAADVLQTIREGKTDLYRTTSHTEEKKDRPSDTDR